MRLSNFNGRVCNDYELARSRSIRAVPAGYGVENPGTKSGIPRFLVLGGGCALVPRVPGSAGSAGLLYRWKQWDCGGPLWIRYSSRDTYLWNYVELFQTILVL